MSALKHLLLAAALLLGGFSTRAAFAEEPSANSAGATQARPPQRVSFAVVIGNNQSLGRRRPELHYADDDAARYFEILKTLAPGRVWLLSELDRDTERLFPEAKRRSSAPSRRNLQAVGLKLAEQVRAARAKGQETDVYFIFAGHGDVDQGEGFIEMTDARFRSRDLSAWLRAIPFSRAHVILDSCNSFFMLGVRKPGGRHFATSEDAARALGEKLPNVGVFLSTSADGEAFEWSEIQSGIFSHVVRSGLLGAADANGDGNVSYLELAAFVDTATAEVKNPNMRPHVFARGPGARDATPIVQLSGLSNVRRLELSDSAALRVRLRDKNGLPLLDAHNEPARGLRLALPMAWAEGAVLERTLDAPSGAGPTRPALFDFPAEPGVVTLAQLEAVEDDHRVRGPDDTFQHLFAEPFGPRALEGYVLAQSRRAPPVYGVSAQDAVRMELVLDTLASSERGRRVNEAMGGIGFGALLLGAGIGVLKVDPDTSSGDKTEARILGGSLAGLGGLFVIGGTGALFGTTKGEQAAADFRRVVRAGGDPARAYADADRTIQEIIDARHQERIGAAVVGSLIMAGCATGFIWSELAADPGDKRMGPRLGWGAGFIGGGMIIGEALLLEKPADTLTRIWRDDPSLNQYQLKPRYQPALTLMPNGAFLSLSGSL